MKINIGRLEWIFISVREVFFLVSPIGDTIHMHI